MEGRPEPVLYLLQMKHTTGPDSSTNTISKPVLLAELAKCEQALTKAGLTSE
jgi:hypothetical protein